MNSKSPQTIPQGWYNSPEILSLSEIKYFINTGGWLPTQGNWPNRVITWRRHCATGQSSLHVTNRVSCEGFITSAVIAPGLLVRDGSGNCRQFTCRYHAWRYDSTGNLLKTPGLRRDEEIDYSQFSLFPIRVTAWNDMIFVCLDRTGCRSAYLAW